MKDVKYIPALSFNFLTGYYDKVIKWVMPAGFRNILVRELLPLSNESILDFGTGTGELAILIKKEAATSRITAIDIDPKVLKIAAKKIDQQNLDIRIIEYDGTAFPLESDCFDKVVSCLVFHHLSPDLKSNALSEIMRVLKVGGKVYIADWGLERNHFKARILKLYKHFAVLKHLVEHGMGLFPGYMLKAGFKNVVESSYIKTKSGTLCYYEAQK